MSTWRWQIPFQCGLWKHGMWKNFDMGRLNLVPNSWVTFLHSKLGCNTFEVQLEFCVYYNTNDFSRLEWILWLVGLLKSNSIWSILETWCVSYSSTWHSGGGLEMTPQNYVELGSSWGLSLEVNTFYALCCARSHANFWLILHKDVVVSEWHGRISDDMDQTYPHCGLRSMEMMEQCFTKRNNLHTIWLADSNRRHNCCSCKFGAHSNI